MDSCAWIMLQLMLTWVAQGLSQLLVERVLHCRKNQSLFMINLETPVTFKIRSLKSSQDTVELAMRIEKTGVSALAVHGRKVADRPRDPAKWGEIADVVASISIPLIANGDVFEHKDIERNKIATGASSVMIARGALWNASIFSPRDKLPLEDVKRAYIRKGEGNDNALLLS